ncbi:PfkB family carbohydrate kinase, partial [Pseudomonadales bacterium]|nr:PfkB family carbohydrate kinase [Pseudomonadales bacterium]
GKGMLRQEATQNMIASAREHGIPVIVDPKGGEYGKYQNASILTPNLREISEVVGSFNSDAERKVKALQVIEDLKLEFLLVTLGAEGMVLFSSKGVVLEASSQAHQAFDVSGAGDTVVAILASELARGSEIKAAVTKSNFAAGIAVQRIGTATVSREEIEHEVQGKN